MNYRVYLLQAGHIGAAESFGAGNDAEAKEIAAQLYKACSDVFESCELWCRHDRIATLTALSDLSVDGMGAVGLDDVVRLRQANLLDLEDNLERTFSAIRRSRKLLVSSAKLRDRLGRGGTEDKSTISHAAATLAVAVDTCHRMSQ